MRSVAANEIKNRQPTQSIKCNEKIFYGKLLSEVTVRMADSDGAAIALLKRAVELDSAKRYTESLVHYKEGLQLLLEYIKVN